MTAAVTPLEALRRLYDVARKVEADEAQGFDNLLQGEIAVARDVLREHRAMRAAPMVPVAAQPVVNVPEVLGYTSVNAPGYLRDSPYSSMRIYGKAMPDRGVTLAVYAATPSLEAQPAGEVERDAARYRWLIAQTPCNIAVMLECSIGEINDEIDAAMAQGDKV